MISVTPCALSRSMMCAITGRSSTGTIGFGSSYVIGRSRVPRPAARTIAFTGAMLLARPALARSRSLVVHPAAWHARGCTGVLRPAGEVAALIAGELIDPHAECLERETR